MCESGCAAYPAYDVMYNMPVFASRKQLDSVSSSSNRTRSPRPPPPSSVPAPVRTSAALLANDLLDVECHLQSKVRVLEEDRQKMAAQVVELQHLLLKAEEKRQRDIEELALQHKNALCTLEVEKEELSAELERSEEGREQEVKAVRVQWEADRGRLNGEVATLTNQLKELEHSYGTWRERWRRRRVTGIGSREH